MNAEAAKVIVGHFATSGFDALAVMLGSSFSVEPAEPEEMDAAAIAALAEKHPVCMRAKVVGGGAVALLLKMDDAVKLMSLVNSEESPSKDALDEGDAGMFQEIASAVLGGGIASIADQYDMEIELEPAEVMWDDAASTLPDFIGQPAAGSSLTFSEDPNFDSTAGFVYTQEVESRIPDGSPADADDEVLVSNEEVQDILSGFTPEDEPDRAAGPSGPTGPLPENLAVIMDIELVATARLGKVHLPLSEIMNFGPGSIIEVGHLVDEPVDLLINDKLIARGDVVVVDEKFGLRITEIISPQERIESLR